MVASQNVVDAENQIKALTFWLEDTLYAVSIRNVLSINKAVNNVTPLPAKEAGLMGMVRFQDQVVQVYDFAEMIGLDSGLGSKDRKIEDLQEVREQLSLNFNRLEAFVAECMASPASDDQEAEEGAEAEASITDGTDMQTTCADFLLQLNEWVSSCSKRDQNLVEMTTELEQVIAKLKEDLVGIWNKFEAKDYMTCVQCISQSKNAAFRRLEFLLEEFSLYFEASSRPVFLYLTEDGQKTRTALFIDEVNSIVSYEPEDFSTSGVVDAVNLDYGRDIVQGFLCQDGEPDCLLINVNDVMN